MRLRFTAMLAVALVCFVSANAQVVIETDSSVVFGEDGLAVTLTYEHSGPEFDARASVELLDKNGAVATSEFHYIRVREGRRSISFTLPIADISELRDDLMWYRLRYRVGRAHGIVSISQLIKDFFEISVSSPETVRAGQTFRTRVRANDPFKKQPVSDVEVTARFEMDVYSGEDEDADAVELEAKAKTDGTGIATLEFKIPEKIRIDESCNLKISAEKFGFVRDVSMDVDGFEESEMVLLTLDKPIYQPGQNFSARAILFDTTRAVISGGELEFSIFDEEGTLMFRESVNSSDFGIASISWPIPESAKLGDYKLKVSGDDDIDGGTQTFRITRYDLPKFSVKAKPGKPFYLISDTIANVNVTADYLFGKPVTKGKVRVIIENDRKWNWKKQAWDIDSDQTIEGETDARGSFVAKVDLRDKIRTLEKNSWRRFEDLHLAAYFTDLTSNRTEQRRFDIRISKEPIHVYLSVGNYRLHAGLPVTSYLSSFYPDGRPASCKIRMEVKGESEDESAYKVIAETNTNSYGAGKIVFQMPKLENAADYLDVRVTARDSADSKGTFEDELYFNDQPGIAVAPDKAINIPGKPLRFEILSTLEDGPVFVDITRGWSVVASRNVGLKNGRASVEIPYSPALNGDLHIWAYAEYTDEDEDVRVTVGTASVIYPQEQNLLVEPTFSSPAFKPGEDARVSFTVNDGSGKPARSALGVVLFDKAVEERARTDAEFGSYFSRFNDWLGKSTRFGSTTLKDLNDIDTTKPVSDDLQLTAELVLLGSGNHFRPEVRRSEISLTEPQSIFKDYFAVQFAPIVKALNKQFSEDHTIATDDPSFERILSKHGQDLSALTDPWGEHYRARFSVSGKYRTVEILSGGADKKFGTRDDLDVKRMNFEYFRPVADVIIKVTDEMRTSARGYIRDYQTLKAELAKEDLDLDSLRDPWGRKFKFTFDVLSTNYVIEVRTAGADGKWEKDSWLGDDAVLGRILTNYFATTQLEINRALAADSSDVWKFPETVEEFWEVLKQSGISKDSVRDGFGRPAFVTTELRTRYSDKTRIDNGKTTITPMTETIRYFYLRSAGKDGKWNGDSYSYDDFTLATFSSSITQRFRSIYRSRDTIRNIVYKGSSGAISGVVMDATGAVIPGASVSLSSEARDISKSKTTKENGEFLFENLPSGSYRLEASAPGFVRYVRSNIRVRAYSLTQVDVSLEVGTVTAMLSVVGARAVINTSDATIGRTFVEPKNAAATGVQMSTPRLREYFPETLVWQPELITDEQGKAELKFKMADNITTWKMYTVASTKNGKIGVSENEVTAFQPFFADLEPPKFLTTGDEIHLPVQIRNYTPNTQPVNVTMARADWFSFLGPEKRTIDVAADSSENAVFGFRADKAVEGGKQRVTAIAAEDSDAIEKPVTVRPNGQEITSSDSRLFSGSAEFKLDFPADAIEEGRNGRLRLYPNLLANVADSADGLLHRPYGCGEQTISSTYPNLMILKLAPDESPLRLRAKKFLKKGYERLLGYQDSSGGFTYWGTDGTADISLTAYAIRFLTDASSKIEVDEDVIRKAEKWLVSQQRPDGSWTHKYSWEREENTQRTKMITSYAVRALAMSRDPEAKQQETETALGKGLEYLKRRNSEIDEPYAMALYGLASLDAGYPEEAAAVAAQLEKMMIPEGNAAYWKLETNTPFYGWGTAGRIEATALVVQLLERTSKSGGKRTAVQKGTMFLMKKKDRYGVWYSTQTTINVLDALIASLDRSVKQPVEKRTAEIAVNGKIVRTLDLPPANEMVPAFDIDLTNDLGSAANIVTVRTIGTDDVMAQVVSRHYVDWQTALAKESADVGSADDRSRSRLLELDYNCDDLNGKVMQTVSCDVRAERVGFRGYGMLLAEIGIPPGAEVSRESLENAMRVDWSLSRYEVLPDRVVIYMWARPGGSKFNFTFKPRYAINAQTPASVVYDYYNDEARAVVAPLKFSVK